MSTVRHLMDKFTKVFVWIGMILVVAMCLYITAGVIMSYVFNSPIRGSYEVVQLLFSVFVFSALVAAQRSKMHIQINMLVRILPGAMKYIVNGIMYLLGTGTCAVITIAMFKQGAKALGLLSHTDVLGIVYYPFYYAFGVLMAVYTLQMLLDTIQNFTAIVNKDDAAEISKSWA